MKTTFIYTLSCPKSGDIKYVGKSNDPKGRFYKHRQLSGNNKLKNDWIDKLRFEKLLPVLTVIDEVLISDWKEMEKFYIAKYRNMGCELLNSSSGGDGMSFGNQTSFDGRNARKIVALTKTGEFYKTFDSAKEAAAYIGKHNISSALKGVTKKAGGYIWLYEQSYNQLSEKELAEFVDNANNNLSKFNGSETRFKKNQKSWNAGLIGVKLKPNKNVHQYTIDGEYIKTWRTAKEAATSLGDERWQHTIGNCARGVSKTALKYKWSYNLIDRTND